MGEPAREDHSWGIPGPPGSDRCSLPQVCNSFCAIDENHGREVSGSARIQNQHKTHHYGLALNEELEVIKKGLTYTKAHAHSQEPQWDTKYPWIEGLISLSNNRNAVEATFLRTERQLKRVVEWWVAYATQLHEMVERWAAKKLTKETVANWKGSVWYASHLIAPNPHSVTTPMRLVSLGDIAKMYNSVWLKDLEMHRCRFLW